MANKLTDDQKQRISDKLHDKPCIKCGENHELSVCKSTDLLLEGALWKVLSTKAKRSAEAHLKKLLKDIPKDGKTDEEADPLVPETPAIPGPSLPTGSGVDLPIRSGSDLPTEPADEDPPFPSRLDGESDDDHFTPIEPVVRKPPSALPSNQPAQQVTTDEIIFPSLSLEINRLVAHFSSVLTSNFTPAQMTGTIGSIISSEKMMLSIIKPTRGNSGFSASAPNPSEPQSGRDESTSKAEEPSDIDVPKEEANETPEEKAYRESQEKRKLMAEAEQKRQELRDNARVVIPDYPQRDPGDACDKSKEVKTNHYLLKIDPDKEFFEYEIVGLSVGRNERSLIEKVIQKSPLLEESDNIATDYRSTIIAWKNIHADMPLCKDSAEPNGSEGATYGPFDISYGKPLNDVQPTRTFCIKLIRQLNFEHLQHYVDAKDLSLKLWNSSPEIRALNIMISKCFDRAHMVQLGANKFFDKGSATDLSTGNGSLYTMRGYFYTTKPAMGGILLNINTATSAFYKAQSVENFLLDQNAFRDLQDRKQALRGVQVKIGYGRGRTQADRDADFAFAEGRIKPIEYVSDNTIANETFRIAGQTNTTSVQDYLHNTYGTTFPPARVRNLYAVNLGTASQKTWYSPSDLDIEEYQIYRRPVPSHLTDSMLQSACYPPEDNKTWVEAGFLQGLEMSSMKSDGFCNLSNCDALAIKPKLLIVDADTIPYPEIKYKDTTFNMYSKSKKKGESKWILKSHQFINNGFKPQSMTMGVSLKKSSEPQPPPPHEGKISALLLVDPSLEFPDTKRRYEEALKKFFIDYQIGKHPDRHIFGLKTKNLASINEDEIQRKLQDYMEESQEGGTRFVFLLLEKRNIAAYQYFKTVADRQFGLRTLCLTEGANAQNKKDSTGKPMWPIQRELKPDLNQYFGNVMMKANLKFGGINHTTQRVHDFLKSTLVLGADVTHPGANSIEGCPSIAAVVGSVEERGGKFLGSMRLQSRDKRDREIIDDMESMVEERLADWYENMGTKKKEMLKNILYYRDGVSEGQYARIRDEEVEAIRQAVQNFKKSKNIKGPDPKITAVIVAKRHHTRFYPEKDDDKEGKADNCMPGTVVDQEVTSPYFMDFFLQSHSGLQGTARPAHYFVIENGIGMKCTELQKLTHELCYTYVRATLGVSYASPAYYADRLCDRGRAYLRDYLNGTPMLRARIRNFKSQEQTRLQQIRSRTFPRSRQQNGKYPPKTDLERYAELVDRAKVTKACRNWTMEHVRTTWSQFGGSLTRNPWDAKIKDTMFWM